MAQLQHDGRTIAHQVTGDGPPLVLLHGITESSRAWDPVLEHLTGQRQVVAVDLRGHGGSDPGADHDLEGMADDVAAVIDHLGIDAPDVVGHSLGGIVAAVLGARHPVRRVVVVDQPLALAGFKEALAPVEEMLRGEAFPAVIGQMFDGFSAPLPVAEQERLAGLRRPEQQVVLDVWSPVFEHSVEELDGLVRGMLADLDAPLLALHAEEPGPDYRAWLADVVPGSELEVWPGGGHYPHLADPARFAERVLAFLA